MGRAKILLEGTNLPIAEIAGMVGYGSSGKFSSAFRRTTGFLPAQYRHASLHSGAGDSEADDGSRSGKGARLG
jgi:AraC-like DNA-binding protein